MRNKQLHPVEYSYLQEIKITKGFYTGYYATVEEKHGKTYKVNVHGVNTKEDIYVTPKNSRTTNFIDWIIQRFI